MDNEKEISFGAFDSELMHQEIYIPEGFEATIDGDKIILTRKDSEDERIRKELIGYIVKEVGLYPGEDRKEHKWLRWLEKQGEHKKFRDSIQVGDEVTRNSDGVIVNLSQLKRVAKKSEQKLPIEKLPEEMKTIGESLGFTTQEECDEYNKMVSDLIMSDEEDYNNIDPHFGKLINKVESKFKDGDVLSYRNGQWIFIYKEKIDDSSFNYHILYSTIHQDLTINDAGFTLLSDAIIPATKEQRDLLFQKMKEAGYEWDSEKKELKKIEQKPQRIISAEVKEAMYDKPAWSEEDEYMLSLTSDLLNYHLQCRKWLKSLIDRVKSQNTWKPSGEQMEVLAWCKPLFADPKLKGILESLIEDLKKLREE